MITEFKISAIYKNKKFNHQYMQFLVHQNRLKIAFLKASATVL